MPWSERKANLFLMIDPNQSFWFDEKQICVTFLSVLFHFSREILAKTRDLASEKTKTYITKVRVEMKLTQV